MKPERIRLFIKPHCGWCHEVMDWFDRRKVSYQKLDVIGDPRAYAEMQTLSGQTRSPVMQADGEILADFGVAELEVWWKERGFA